MKNLLIVFMLISSSRLHAQKFYGMIEFATDTFIDATEITNNEYRQFVSSLDENSRENYLPDTTVLASIDSVSISLYYSHPVYDNYPVIGITYNQALAFCEWRTKIYNENPKNKVKVKFDLPTEEQWNAAARFKTSEAIYAGVNSNDLSNPSDRKEMKFIKKYSYLINSISANKKAMVSCNDTYGAGQIIGLAGNVAEMTKDKKVVGGSFAHDLSYAKIGSTIEHDINVPSCWLGFRCVLMINK